MDRTLAITAVPPVTPPQDFVGASVSQEGQTTSGSQEGQASTVSPRGPEGPDEGPPFNVDPPPLPDYDSGYGSA